MMEEKTIRKAAFLWAASLLPVLALAQLPLPGAVRNAAPVALDEGLSEQRAKAETQLAETLRQRHAEAPGSREIAGAEAVRGADRQRQLDRLAYLQGEKIKKLDELAALQKAPPFVPANLPQVQAIGNTPPYSVIAVDALRDELDGVKENLEALLAGVPAREVEKQALLEQKRRADEAVRLSNDRLALARGETNKAQEKWTQEESELRQRIAESELSLLSIDEDLLRLKIDQLRTQSDALEDLVTRVRALQQLSEEEVDAQRARVRTLRSRLADEIGKADKRRIRHQEEQAGLLAKAAGQGSAESQDESRLALLDQALLSDGVVRDVLNGLDTVAQVTVEAWEKRYLIVSGADAEQRRLALASLGKLQQGLLTSKRGLQEKRNAAQGAVREQETRIANMPPESGEQRQAKELLGLLQERATMYERLDLAASRLERQLARWNADFSQVGTASVGGQAKHLGQQLASLLRAFWHYELFAVEDVSDVDGRKVVVNYGVTIGKSVGALMLFVLGYWLFSKLVQWLQIVLVRRFGFSDQLASVIRRWVMIALAMVLIVSVLNLARIPLTVFAFLGGALAIGVGFGTQTIIKNFISGIIILFERKIRVGDIIELGGMAGHVTAVDLRATTVRGFDGVEALIPNSNFLETQVVNWTYSNYQIRRELRIGVAYGTASRVAEALLLKAAVEHPQVLETPAPEVFFEDFADSALLMVLVYWVELGPNMVARRVDSELRHTIYQALAEAGIAIPFPQRDLHLDLTLPVPVSVVAADGEPPRRQD